MKRLLFISTGLGIGGAEISLLNLLQHLDRDCFELHVVSLNGRGPIGERIERLGIATTAFDFKRHPVRGLLGLHALVRRLRPHLVQTWMYHADLLGGIVARLAGVRAVVWGIRHSTLDPQSSRRSTRWIAKACAAISGTVPRAAVSCSALARDVHQVLGYRPARFEVIVNGFDLAQLRPDAGSREPVRAELGLPPSSPLVLHVARYHPDKNHLGLVHAIGLVHRQRHDVQFALVGQGVERGNAELDAAIDAAGIDAVVHRLGVRDDIARLMAAADTAVLSSISEAFPRVLGEALACGLPCVATDVGDCRAVVGDCGRIVPAKDSAALAAAVLDVLGSTPQQRAQLQQCARQRSVRLFDIRAVANRYAALYLQLIDSTE